LFLARQIWPAHSLANPLLPAHCFPFLRLCLDSCALLTFPPGCACIQSHEVQPCNHQVVGAARKLCRWPLGHRVASSVGPPHRRSSLSSGRRVSLSSGSRPLGYSSSRLSSRSPRSCFSPSGWDLPSPSIRACLQVRDSRHSRGACLPQQLMGRKG
jgi:hypothetical protein